MYVVTKESQALMWSDLAIAFKRGHRRVTGLILSDGDAGLLADHHMKHFPTIYGIGEHPDIDLPVSQNLTS